MPNIRVLLLKMMLEIAHGAALAGRIADEQNRARTLESLRYPLVVLVRFGYPFAFVVRLFPMLEMALKAMRINGFQVIALDEMDAVASGLEEACAMMVDGNNGSGAGWRIRWCG